MKRLFLIWLALASLMAPSWARDFGPGAEVSKVKATVRSKIGPAANVSVSHDWAMCIATAQGNDVSVLLHRVGGKWKVVDTDGGAWDLATLRAKGVPSGDATVLHKTYQ